MVHYLMIFFVCPIPEGSEENQFHPSGQGQKLIFERTHSDKVY